MKLLSFIIVSIAIFMMANPAVAEVETNPQEKLFLDYLAENDAYNQTLKDKSQRIFNITFPGCTTINSVKRLTPQIIMPPRYEDLTLHEINKPYTFENTNPTRGQWIDRSIIEGCGKITQVNYIVTAYSLDKLPVMYPALNGQTRISLIEQRRAETAVSEKLLSDFNCRERPMIMGSIFLGYRTEKSGQLSPNDQRRGWFERWVVRTCDTTKIINLAILPDSTEGYKYVTQIAKSNSADSNFTEADADK